LTLSARNARRYAAACRSPAVVLHPRRRETLEWLKKSYTNELEEELLKEMEAWGF
jgi:hypothetical protein